jgi:hypothetical protein
MVSLSNAVPEVARKAIAINGWHGGMRRGAAHAVGQFGSQMPGWWW